MSDSVNVHKHSLLIEEPSIPMMDNTNAYFAKVICEAKHYKPFLIVDNQSQTNRIYDHYFTKYQFIKIKSTAIYIKIYLWLLSIWHYFKLFLGYDILNISYDGVMYGDFIYDEYLANNHYATLHFPDKKIIRAIHRILKRHYDIVQLFKRYKIDAVLVSHQVGVRSGVMLRASLRYGAIGYFHSGHHNATLQKFSQLSQIYNYQHKASKQDIKKIIRYYGKDLEKAFNKLFKMQTRGEGEKNSREAFFSIKKHYISRNRFCQDHHLPRNKKNIFVMLHAMNDYPHSHFKKFIFRDYYEWMIHTLNIAKSDSRVNWIFKQHPVKKYYPTTDISFKKIFSNLPNHIVYIGGKNQINTKSLIKCADAVITCAGSAGFEMPAISRIPSIISVGNHYSDLGIAIEAKNIKHYDQILNTLTRVKKITRNTQKQAMAVYLYIYYLSSVTITAFPKITYEEEKSQTQEKWYWDRVLKLYEKHSSQINSELETLINIVKKDNFYRLTRFNTEKNILKI